MTDQKEVENIITESGNSFHCRVNNYLRNAGWHTLVSPYYMDGSTNKSRELDLIAEKHWDYSDNFKQKFGILVMRLFIECKYIPQPNVFWFSDMDIAAATEWLVSNAHMKQNNAYTEKHHYLSLERKVAKLFASKNKPNPENEGMFRALNQSLNAMVYLRGGNYLIPKVQESHGNKIRIELPVIVCNSFDKFYRVEMENPSMPKKIDDNFKLEVNYAYLDRRGNHRNEYFLLDIVNFERMDDYLKVIEADKNAIKAIL